MARTRCVDKSGMKKGAWTPEEDSKLVAYITRYGSWNWRQLPRFAGLARCGKSCRLRWLNYLRPNIKRGNYTQEEEDIIVTMHKKIGNKWSVIASNLPGRTDNDIKNHWHSSLKRRAHQRNTRQKVKATAAATATAAVTTTTNPNLNDYASNNNIEEHNNNINNSASLQYSPQTSSDTVSEPLSPQLSSTIITTTNNHNNEINSDHFDDIDFLNYYTQHAIENLWSETFLAEQRDNGNGGFGSPDTKTTQIPDSSELLSPQSSSLSSAENNDNLFTFAETTETAFDEEFWTEQYAVDLSYVPNELLTPYVDQYFCPMVVYDDLDLWTQSNFTL